MVAPVEAIIFIAGTEAEVVEMAAADPEDVRRHVAYNNNLV